MRILLVATGLALLALAPTASAHHCEGQPLPLELVCAAEETATGAAAWLEAEMRCIYSEPLSSCGYPNPFDPFEGCTVRPEPDCPWLGGGERPPIPL